VPYVDLADPRTLNLYAYARNNPLSKTDPDGHCGYPECDIVMHVVQYVATHAAAAGIGMSATRQEYVRRASAASSPAESDALKIEMRGEGPALGRELAN
jgi:hypothetical protein